MRVLIGVILIFFEVAVLWWMFSLSRERLYPTWKKPEKEVVLDGVELRYSFLDFATNLHSERMNFNAELDEVNFPSAEGGLFINGRVYRIIMENGKIFLNRWGFLQGKITIESKEEKRFFRAEGKDFRIDFRNKTIYSGNRVKLETESVFLAGNRLLIDFKNRIIRVSGGVKGEIKNFVP